MSTSGLVGPGAWTADRVRVAEDAARAGHPDDILMRRAGAGLARYVASWLTDNTGGVTGRRVTLLVGSGDNGGDALWAGAGLRRRGVGVTAVLVVPDRAHAGGLTALRRAGGRTLDGSLPDAVVPRADVVLDGIVGISGRGGLRPDAARMVAGVVDPIIAVDLPSGVDTDTGRVDGAAVAPVATVTFGCRKPVHVLAAPRCGPVHLVDLGLAPYLGEPDLHVLTAVDAGRRWPVPGVRSDKYTQGVVGVAAGSAKYPGAAVLATGAAVLATSGMVRFAGSAADAVRARWPEVVATGSVADAGRVQAWVVGPGMGTGAASRDVLAGVLAAGVPVCADADAINLLSAHPDLADHRDPDTALVLTPHAGEFRRLTGVDVGADGVDRVASVRAAAARFGATVLLKGNTTVIADPAGRTWVNPARTSWAATAGSGDVLSGVIGALLASGLEPPVAAATAAHVHEAAAAIAAGGAPAPASALQAALPDAVRSVLAAARLGTCE